MRRDLVLVGAGLANGLLAYRLAKRRPDLSIAVLDSGPAGGNHTWSFHEGDLTASQLAWMAPFVVHRWPGYDVAFPGFRRRLGLPYLAVTSDRFAATLRDRLGDRLREGVDVASVEPTRVLLPSGEVLEAGATVDATGWRGTAALEIAYQKFLGREVRLAAPHGLDRPMLMDATLPQEDGFRFVYVLPFGADRLLVEETRYSDGASLDAPRLAEGIDAYLAARGWAVREVVREEAGILPITLDGDIGRFWSESHPDQARAGLRAALYHPTTGYSLPDAVRLADHVAELGDLRAPALAAAIRDWSIAKWRAERFLRALNRMLFRAGAPDRRREVFARFYRLPEDLVGRFYANRLGRLDAVRLIAGKPPVPVLGALRALPPRLTARPA